MEESVFERDPSDPAHKEVNPLLKLALELGPLMVFFFANARGEWLIERFPVLANIGEPIFIATALFMAATAIALSVSWILIRSLPIMPLISGIVVLVFGALTLWLHNDTFIKMKPTIVNTLFGDHSAWRTLLRQIAARLCVRQCLQAECRRLAQADHALGYFLPVPRRAE